MSAMRRRYGLAFLVMCVMACAVMAAVAELPRGRASVADPSSATLECSRPSGDAAYWRAGQAISATFTASPWRLDQLHARLAASPLRVALADIRRTAGIF